LLETEANEEKPLNGLCRA